RQRSRPRAGLVLLDPEREPTNPSRPGNARRTRRPSSATRSERSVDGRPLAFLARRRSASGSLRRAPGTGARQDRARVPRRAARRRGVPLPKGQDTAPPIRLSFSETAARLPRLEEALRRQIPWI